MSGTPEQDTRLRARFRKGPSHTTGSRHWVDHFYGAGESRDKEIRAGPDQIGITMGLEHRF